MCNEIDGDTLTFTLKGQDYSKYFSLGYLGNNMSDKFAIIALTCYITKEIRKKGKKINCYDILFKRLSNTFFI